MKIRNLLIEKRMKKGLTLRAAGEICKLDFSTILNLETFKREGTIDVWKKIQKGYQIKDKDMWLIITSYKYVEKKPELK